MSQTSSCAPCGKSMMGPESYKAHVESPKHLKRMEELNRLSSNRQYYCDICKKECNGPIPFDAHMNSEAHAKQVRKNELEREFHERQGASQEPGRSPVTAALDVVRVRPVLKCPLCDTGDLMCLSCKSVIHVPLPAPKDFKVDMEVKKMSIALESISPSAPPDDSGAAPVPVVDSPAKILNLYPNLQSDDENLHRPAAEFVPGQPASLGAAAILSCEICGIEKFRSWTAMSEHLASDFHHVKEKMNLNDLS